MGGTLRAHLLKVYQATGERPRQLDQPAFPEEFVHVVGWLRRLPCPVEWATLQAFAQMTRTTMSRWEVDLLMRLDQMRQ